MQVLLIGRLLSFIVAIVFLVSCTTVPPIDLKEVALLRADADTYYQAKDYERAIPAYQELIESLPGLAESWFRLGNCYSRLGDYPLAINAYDKAIGLNPEYVKAWYNLSYVRAQMLVATIVQMYQSVPNDDPEARKIRAFVEAVLEPFGKGVTDTLPQRQSIAEPELAPKPAMVIGPKNKGNQPIEAEGGVKAVSAERESNDGKVDSKDGSVDESPSL